MVFSFFKGWKKQSEAPKSDDAGLNSNAFANRFRQIYREEQAKKKAAKKGGGEWHPYGNPNASSHKFAGRRTGSVMKGARGHGGK